MHLLKSKLTGIFFLVLLIYNHSFAEKIPEDAWQWTTVSVDKKITRHWSVGLDEELRLFDNMSRINLFFTNVGVTYKINSFKFSLVYRFVNKNQDEYYSKRHRLYFDAAYKYNIKKFTIAYRLRFQGQVRDYYSSDFGRSIESYSRSKFDFSYDVKKYSPFVAAEFRFQISNPSFHEADKLWDRMRYYAGCTYSFNRMHSVQLYYMFQHDFNNNRLENDFTLGVQYSLNL
jgi:hypothetical protein